MFKIIDNRSHENYLPQVRDLSIGEFFEYDGNLFIKTYEGSPNHFEAFDFTEERTVSFCGIEEVEVLKNIKIVIENN